MYVCFFCPDFFFSIPTPPTERKPRPIAIRRPQNAHPSSSNAIFGSIRTTSNGRNDVNERRGHRILEISLVISSEHCTFAHGNQRQDHKERCRSGRTGRTRNAVNGQLFRGFESLSLRHKGVNQTMFGSHLFHSHLFSPNRIKIKNTLSTFPLSNIDKPTHLFNATALLNQIGMNVQIQCSRNVGMPEYCTHRLVVALALYATRRKGVAKSMKNNRGNL